jgi:hypothetical protein
MDRNNRWRLAAGSSAINACREVPDIPAGWVLDLTPLRPQAGEFTGVSRLHTGRVHCDVE